jgi:hypothetical protein
MSCFSKKSQNISSKYALIEKRDTYKLRKFFEVHKQYQFSLYLTVFFLEQDSVHSDTKIKVHFACGCDLSGKAKLLISGVDFKFYQHHSIPDYYYLQTKSKRINLARVKLPTGLMNIVD